jgi:hypothetical protein
MSESHESGKYYAWKLCGAVRKEMNSKRFSNEDYVEKCRIMRKMRIVQNKCAENTDIGEK